MPHQFTGVAPTRRRGAASTTTYTATVHAGGRRLYVGRAHATPEAAAAARDGALVALVGGPAAVAAGLNLPPAPGSAQAARLAASKPLTGPDLTARLAALSGPPPAKGRPRAPRCGVCPPCRAHAAGVGRKRKCERAAEAEAAQPRAPPRRREEAAPPPPPPPSARPPKRPLLHPPPPLRVTDTPPLTEPDLRRHHARTQPVPPPPPGTLEAWAPFDYQAWIRAATARGGARLPRARARERGDCRACGGAGHEAVACPLVAGAYGRVSRVEGGGGVRSAVSSLVSALAVAGAAGSGGPPPDLGDAGLDAVVALARAVAAESV